jgi:hypothetical protein
MAGRATIIRQTVITAAILSRPFNNLVSLLSTFNLLVENPC